MSRVIVVGDVDAFRHIVASALRSMGVDVEEAEVRGDVLSRLESEQPQVVIVHPPEGVFRRAYLEQVTRVVHGARVFVVTETESVTSDGDGNITYVSRIRVRELVDTVRRLAGQQLLPTNPGA